MTSKIKTLHHGIETLILQKLEEMNQKQEEISSRLASLEMDHKIGAVQRSWFKTGEAAKYTGLRPETISRKKKQEKVKGLIPKYVLDRWAREEFGRRKE